MRLAETESQKGKMRTETRYATAAQPHSYLVPGQNCGFAVSRVNVTLSIYSDQQLQHQCCPGVVCYVFTASNCRGMLQFVLLINKV